MASVRSLLFLAFLWAAAYLSGLGLREIKGEEGRRILPALAMIESGNWLVPHLNGEPYLRKPPLVNWAIAGSFLATGRRDEWAARLPSALSALAVAATLYAAGAGWVGHRAALAGGAMALTLFGMMEKGRIAEIEGLYVALTAIPILLWCALVAAGKPRWIAWLAAAPFLGLGLLAKGPLHLLFFGAVVAAVGFRLARASGSTRVAAAARAAAGLLSPPALAGWLLAAAFFAAWAVPFFREIPASQAAGEWGEQSAGRLGDQFDLAGWLSNIPRALSDLLPWVFLAPLLWKKGGGVARSPVLAGLRDAAALCFFGLLLVPGVLPRYLLPFAPCFALLAAASLADLPEKWRARWSRGTAWIGGPSADAPGAALRTAVLAGAIIAALAWTLPPLMEREGGQRACAAAIDRATPAGTPLAALDIGYQPMLFYLRHPVRFLHDDEELQKFPSATVLTQKKVVKKLTRDFREVRELAEIAPPNAKRLWLLSVEGPPGE